MNWREEALAIISDIQADVREVKISDSIAIDEEGVHLNLKTLDGESFCIKLSGAGFSVVGHAYDTCDQESPIYETPYALLSVISKLYTESFANRLSSALSGLENRSRSTDSDSA